MNSQEKQKWEYAELEDKILSVALMDKVFFLALKENIYSTFFVDEINGKIFKILVKFFDKYNFLPTKEVLITLSKKVFKTIEDADKVIEKINTIYDTKILHNEKEFIENEIDNFIKRYKMKNAILKSVSLLEKNQYDEILKIIKDVVKFSSKVDTGYKLTENIQERYIKLTDVNNIIPTFLSSLNLYLDGGFHRGELNIVMAASGYGKSTFLINEAVYALKQNYNVLYITLELNEKQIGYRMDRCLWNKTAEEAKKDWKLLEDKYKVFKKSNAGELYIHASSAYAFTRGDIERLLDRLKTYEDFVPDIIIIDYLELMQTSTFNSRAKEYERQGIIAGELRNLGEEYNATILTATQTNRKVFDLDNDEEQVAEQQVIGESLNKIKIADTFFLILQTKKEAAEDTARLRIVKNRHGKIHIDIPMIVNFDKMKMEEKII